MHTTRKRMKPRTTRDWAEEIYAGMGRKIPKPSIIDPRDDEITQLKKKLRDEQSKNKKLMDRIHKMET